MAFKAFSEYSDVELRNCGAKFVEAVGACREDIDGFAAEHVIEPTPCWTEFVLDWFAQAAAKSLCVDARRREDFPGWNELAQSRLAPEPRTTQGEFLVDLAHTTYPQYSRKQYYYSPGYYRVALERECQVRLALESEWGKAKASGETFRRVIEDAAKPAAMRADVKVMIFGAVDQANHDEIVEGLAALRTQSRDAAPWLWVDIPEKGVAKFDALAGDKRPARIRRAK